jgi:hypothetical protein
MNLNHGLLPALPQPASPLWVPMKSADSRLISLAGLKPFGIGESRFALSLPSQALPVQPFSDPPSG